MQEVEKMQKLADWKEQEVLVKNDIDKMEEINNLYVNTIKAKLALLDQI